MMHNWKRDQTISYRASREDYWVCDNCGVGIHCSGEPVPWLQVTFLIPAVDPQRPQSGVRMTCEEIILHKVMQS